MNCTRFGREYLKIHIREVLFTALGKSATSLDVRIIDSESGPGERERKAKGVFRLLANIIHPEIKIREIGRGNEAGVVLCLNVYLVHVALEEDRFIAQRAVAEGTTPVDTTILKGPTEVIVINNKIITSTIPVGGIESLDRHGACPRPRHE